jgi:hypothetical protein
MAGQVLTRLTIRVGVTKLKLDGWVA